MKDLQAQKDQAKKDIVLQADQFKAQVSKARDQKTEAEQNLLKVEFLVGEKNREIEKIKGESDRLSSAQGSEIKEL